MHRDTQSRKYGPQKTSFRASLLLLASGIALVLRPSAGRAEPPTSDKPESPEALVEIAEADLQRGRLVQAERSLKAALRLDATNGRAHYVLAKTLDKMGRGLGVREVLELNQAEPGQWVRGRIVIQQIDDHRGRYVVFAGESALSFATRAFELGVQDVQLKLLLGQLWTEGRQWELAARFFEEVDPKSLTSASQRARFHAEYSKALLEAGRFAEALEQIDAANEAGEGVEISKIEALLGIAERYSARGDVDNYLHCLSTAGQMQPTNSTLHLRLGDALWDVGRTAEAVREYQRVLELQPHHADAEKMLQRIRDVRPGPVVGNGDSDSST